MTPIEIPGVDAVAREVDRRRRYGARARRSGGARLHYPPVTTDDHILDDEAGLGLSRGDTLSTAVATAITKAATWGKYSLYGSLAYLVLSPLMPLLGIGATAAAFQDANDELGGQGAAAIIGGLVTVYGILLALYLYPVIRFWGFTHKTPAAIAGGAQAQFVDQIDDLRSVLKYIGVFTLVILGFYAVVLLFVVAFDLSQL